MIDDLLVELEQLEALGRRRSLDATIQKEGAAIKHRGRNVVNFTSWDYLDAANNTEVKRAAGKEIEKLGVGVSASRLSSGTRNIHLACEARIAAFLGMKSAILFSSRNQAVFSLVTALGCEKDMFFADELLQSPVVDAACLIDAPISTFKTSELDSLESELEAARGSRRRLIFVESVSPITGAFAPLDELAELAVKYDASLFVDESFALGAIGARGAGVCELRQLHDKVFCQFGALSFGVGCYGAFVAGDSILTEHLVGYSRTFSSEAAFPPGLARSVEASLDYLELQHAGREGVIGLASELRDAFVAQGLPVTAEAGSPVIALQLGVMRNAIEFADALFNKGYLIDALPSGIPFSDVGVGRIVVTQRHTREQIQSLLQAVSEVYPKIGEK